MLITEDFLEPGYTVKFECGFECKVKDAYDINQAADNAKLYHDRDCEKCKKE